MKLHIHIRITPDDDHEKVLASTDGYLNDFQAQSPLKVISDLKAWVGEKIITLKVKAITAEKEEDE